MNGVITVILIWVIFLTHGSFAEDVDVEGTSIRPEDVVVEKMSEKVRAILLHYQQKDPVGIPGAPIPDPMPIPDMKHSFGVARMDFKNVSVSGLKLFRLEHVKWNLAQLEVSAGLSIETVDIAGKYTMSTWISRSNGPFTVKLTGVLVQGLGRLEVEMDGKLAAQNIEMDITFQKIDMNFENMGFMGSIFQGIINNVGGFLFDSVKPFILSEVNTNVRGDVNKQIRNLPQRFPNSISPFDMSVAEARKYVRKMGYDPYRFPDYTHEVGLFKIEVSHMWVTGLSSFYRVGDILVVMEDNVVHLQASVGTQRLKGSCHWEVGLGVGFLSRAGSASFTIEYFQVEAKVGQPLDTRKRPQIEVLELKLGNIQARVDGFGTMDYALEFLVNILPNLLRYQIMNTIEGPLKARIQEVFDTIDVEKLLDEKLPELDKYNIKMK